MKAHVMKTSRSINAFTLVELLIGLVVTGILLSAVATLAYAMSSASRESDDTAFKEAQLRQARLRIGELVRHCKLICAAPGNDLAIWQADTNNDGKINVAEIVYLERGSGGDVLRLCWFPPTASDEETLADLNGAGTKGLLIAQYVETDVALIPACANVKFVLDAAPPLTRRVTISFDLTENGAAHHYEITEALRAWAGNLLKASGGGVVLVSDDD